MRIYLCALYTFIAKSQGEAKTFTCARYLAHPFSENDEFFGRMYQVASTGKNKHRFPPDRYLFQYNGKSLSDKDLGVCMRFLVHGLVFETLDGRRVTVRSHLLRHGFATWALNVAKEPIDIVAAILNQ